MTGDPDALPTGLRGRVWRQLELSAWRRPGLSPSNRALALMVLISVAAAALLTEPTLEAWRRPLHFVLATCAVVFTAEFAARWWSAFADPGRGERRGGAWAWPFRWGPLLDFAALLGAWAEAMTGVGLGWAVMLRLARVLEVFALDERSPLGRAATELWSAVRARRLEFGIAASLAGMLVMMASVAIYMVEREVQPEIFGSIPRAMWWAIVTLTTVGYGDAIPATALGKAIGAVVALSSVALIALPAGIMAAAFSEAVQRLKRRDGQP